MGELTESASYAALAWTTRYEEGGHGKGNATPETRVFAAVIPQLAQFFIPFMCAVWIT